VKSSRSDRNFGVHCNIKLGLEKFFWIWAYHMNAGSWVTAEKIARHLGVVKDTV
jgi:hypothetical protein